MGDKEVNKKKGKQEIPTIIKVERVYLGGKSMEEAFKPIYENNIRDIMNEYKKAM